MRYFIYCRKSSEEEERQALSIESQLQELREYAQQKGLSIVKEFIESKSAKKPGRPVFNQMLEAIERGEADGILAWQPDRLSRNSVCGGRVIYLIDEGFIKDLQFPSYHFENTPHGKLNLTMAFGFSKMYVDRLSEDVKRGIREKLRRGEFPGKAPLGYYNHPKKRTIEPDPERFEKLKYFLEKFAIGATTQSELRNEMYEAGLKSETGRKLTYFGLRHILTNPFFYGVFKLKGELHQGSHQAMISKETFDRIQKLLTRKSRKVNWTNEKHKEKNYLFQGLARCGNCGYAIVPEWHKKKSGLIFKYYRCSRKSKSCTCKEKAINEKDLAKQVERLVSQVTIPDEWFEKYNHKIDEWVNEEQQESRVQLQRVKAELEQTKTKLDKLLDLHLEGDLNPDEYREKKNKLVNQKSDLEHQLSQISDNGQIWVEPLRDFVKTGNQAYHSILDQDFKQMNFILKKVGLNQQLDQKQLSLNFIKPFNFLSELHRMTGSSSIPDETEQQINEQRSSGTSRGSRKQSLPQPCVSAGSEARSAELSEQTVGLRALTGAGTLGSPETRLRRAQSEQPVTGDSVGLCDCEREWSYDLIG